MSSALLFIALSLAVYRVFRLIGRDDITASFRDWVSDRLKRVPKLLLFLTCEWCLGTWLSLASVYSTHRWLVPLEPHWLLWSVAVACVVGLIGTAVDK